VVDLAVRDHLDPRLRGVLADDPDDLPTAALALLVSPAVVLSDDSDLVDNGFAGQAWWTQAAGDVLIVAEADGTIVGLFGGVGLTTLAVAYGTAGVVRAARRAPLVTMTVAVVILAGSYVLVRCYPLGRLRTTLRELGAAAAMTWQEVTDSQQAAAARLPWVEAPAGRTPTLEERCARLLARVTETLSTADVHEQLHREMAEATPPVATVRRTLAGHPAFVHVGQGRWQLGESAAAPPGRSIPMGTPSGHSREISSSEISPSTTNGITDGGWPNSS
jgi:hypothetical protein